MNYPVNIANFLRTASFYTKPLVAAFERLSELHSVYLKKLHHRCFAGLSIRLFNGQYHVLLFI